MSKHEITEKNVDDIDDIDDANIECVVRRVYSRWRYDTNRNDYVTRPPNRA